MNEGSAPWWVAAVAALGALLQFAHGRGQQSTLNGQKSMIEALRKTVGTLKASVAEEQKNLARERAQVAEWKSRSDHLTTVISEKLQHFPWLATAYADLQALPMERDAQEMIFKKNPARIAAERVKEHAKRVREAEKLFRLTKYRIDFYEKLFPWLIEVSGEDIGALIEKSREEDFRTADDIVADDEDPAARWLSKQEWEALSTTARNQRALDRWKARRDKSPWEIGREFERFVGYALEREGYSVEYFGAIRGYDDLGRDIIARKANDVRIVQCKCWASFKEIHEKHVYQIFGTALDFLVSSDSDASTGQGNLFESFVKLANVTPWLITSTRLSDRAKKAAKLLNVRVQENVELKDYPCIKCNVAVATGEKIYHLPFDVNYDRVKLVNPEERYARTVEEAETLGFRRAFRWRATPVT